MKLMHRGDGARRQPPGPNSPTVEVLFGGESDGPAVGFLRVSIPPGCGMPEHAHNGSDVVVAPTAGTVEISQGDERISVGVGDAVLIRKEEAVGLRNPGPEAAEVFVAAGPAAFVSGLLSWPEPAGAQK